MTKQAKRIPTKEDLSGKAFSLQNIDLPEPFALKILRSAFRNIGRISPKIAGSFAYKLWFRPTRFKTPAREKPFIDSSKIVTHKIGNNEIVTYSWSLDNTGRPLVLLVHGWNGRGTQLGSFVQPLLDNGFRVISFDAPAHGKSTGKQTNLYEIADVIVSLQNLYGTIDATITHSFGGPCTAVAIQKGYKTNRIVSISPPASTRGLVEKFNEALHIPEKAANIMAQLIEKNYGQSIWEDISMKNTVKTIEQPGLIIHDSNDIDVPIEEGKIIAQAWKNSQFMETTGLGHRRILREATVISESVGFIKCESI